MMSQGAASFTIYSGTKDTFRDAHILNRDTLVDTSILGGLGSGPHYPSQPQNADALASGARWRDRSSLSALPHLNSSRSGYHFT